MGVDVPFKIEFPDGRKQNTGGFYTFIGRDALTAWKTYFEKERGYPNENEPAALKTKWVKDRDLALNTDGVRVNYENLIRYKLGLIPRKKGDKYARYGMNLHEWRDVAKTFVRTMYKKTGFMIEGRTIDFDNLAIEFFMGHEVDPLQYDKFYEDLEYTRRQYLIIENRLNILSKDPKVEEIKSDFEGKLKEEKELSRELAARLNVLEQSVKSIKKGLGE